MNKLIIIAALVLSGCCVDQEERRAAEIKWCVDGLVAGVPGTAKNKELLAVVTGRARLECLAAVGN